MNCSPLVNKLEQAILIVLVAIGMLWVPAGPFHLVRIGFGMACGYAIGSLFRAPHRG